MSKYKDREIIEAVKISRSFNEVQKNLNAGKSGSVYMHIKKRIIGLGIDTSHFNPYWNNSNNGGGNKVHFKDLLVVRESKARDKTHKIRRAMLEYGFEHKCSICSISDWLNKELVLQIDHINGVSYDNRPINLRFLCPNCHTQTNNYGFRGNKR